MKYSELKERIELLRGFGFERERWSKSYRGTLRKGKYHSRKYISYEQIKTIRNFREFLWVTIEKMNQEIHAYVKSEGVRA